MARGVRLVADGLKYAEGPRWHEGRLWFSDMLDHRVCSWNDRDGLRTEFIVAEPSGLGFLPDGRVLVVSRGDAVVYAGRRGAALVPFAAPTGIIGMNDLVTDQTGWSYVGASGKQYELGDEHRDWGADAPGQLLAIAPDGSCHAAAHGLALPNGMVITADGKTLVVAETYTGRLLEFRRQADGSLTDRRVLATVDTGMVDGMTLDEEGMFWVGAGDAFLRLNSRGATVEAIEIPGFRCIACMLGGPTGRTLFMAACELSMEAFLRGDVSAKIVACEVDAAQAGWP